MKIDTEMFFSLVLGIVVAGIVALSVIIMMHSPIRTDLEWDTSSAEKVKVEKNEK